MEIKMFVFLSGCTWLPSVLRGAPRLLLLLPSSYGAITVKASAKKLPGWLGWMGKGKERAKLQDAQNEKNIAKNAALVRQI